MREKGLFYTNRPIRGPWEISDWIRQPCLNPQGETERERREKERERHREGYSIWDKCKLQLEHRACPPGGWNMWPLMCHFLDAANTHVHTFTLLLTFSNMSCSTCASLIRDLSACVLPHCGAHVHSWRHMLLAEVWMPSCNKTATEVTPRGQKCVDTTLVDWLGHDKAQTWLMVCFHELFCASMCNYSSRIWCHIRDSQWAATPGSKFSSADSHYSCHTKLIILSISTK